MLKILKKFIGIKETNEEDSAEFHQLPTDEIVEIDENPYQNTPTPNSVNNIDFDLDLGVPKDFERHVTARTKKQSFFQRKVEKLVNFGKGLKKHSEHFVNFTKVIMVLGFIVLFNLLLLAFRTIGNKNYDEINITDKKNTLIEDSFTMVGGAFLMAELTKGIFKRFFSKLSQKFLPQKLLSPGMEQKRHLENSFEKQKDDLSKEHIIAIEDGFRIWDVIEQNWGDSASQRMVQRLTQLLSLPYETMPPIVISNVEQEIKELISTYSPQLQKSMIDFIKQLIVSTYNSCKINNAKFVETPFLLGAPGVGKTRFATKILKLLGIPHKVVLMPNLTNERIMGSGRTDPWETKYELGVIYDFLITSKYQDVVIILDEIDKALDKKNQQTNNFNNQKEFLLSWLLHTLESETTKTKCDVFNFNLDISRVHFILLGNNDILKEFPSLKSRVSKLEFPPLTPKIKCKIALKHFKESIKEYTDKDLMMVQNIALADQFSGVRAMKKVINTYVVHILYDRMTNLLSNGEFSIQEQYKKYTSDNDNVEFKPFKCVGYKLEEDYKVLMDDNVLNDGNSLSDGSVISDDNVLIRRDVWNGDHKKPNNKFLDYFIEKCKKTPLKKKIQNAQSKEKSTKIESNSTNSMQNNPNVSV